MVVPSGKDERKYEKIFAESFSYSFSFSAFHSRTRARAFSSYVLTSVREMTLLIISFTVAAYA